MINNNGFIGDWIKENSRVLDLGCGDGSLLETLSNKTSGAWLWFRDRPGLN